MKYIRFFMVLVFFSTHSFADETTLFKNDNNAVAWQAKKTFLLVSDQTPVGINDDIQVSLETKGVKAQIVVKIPIEKFDSGEESRDEVVCELLKYETNPLMVYRSEALSQSKLKSLMLGKIKELKGQLQIGGQDFPVVFSVVIKGKKYLQGSYEGTLSYFEIEPPSVVGGLITKVKDYIKFYVQINLSQLKTSSQ